MDYKQLILWAVVIIVMVIIEASTVGLVAIWFVVGAIVAFITALFTDALWLQALLFVASAVCLLMFTRPIIKKHLNSKLVPTNIDMNLGKTGIVKVGIDPDNIGGRVVVDGVDWLAVSENGLPITEGKKVVIKEIQGAKLIVAETV